jgi:hypothetical protein
MNITEQILQHKHADQPFTVHLSDGRRFLIPHPDFISTHPSGKGTNLIVYGTAENEEHFIPVFAITSISINATT